MSWYWYIFGLIEVVGFFYLSTSLTKQWSRISEKAFTRRLFKNALVIRVVWVLFSYWFYTLMTGQPYEFEAGDAMMYHSVASDLAKNGFNHIEQSLSGLPPSDRGYPIYLSSIYMIFGNSLLIARLFKSIWSALTCILVYRFATRTFSEPVGRISAIFCMLMPNLIYYCGLNLKEIEMLFLIVAFIERTDYALRSSKFTISNLLLPVLLAGSLFFFRTVLGAVALFSFFTSILFSPNRVIKMGKKFTLIIWILVAAVYIVGGKVSSELEETWSNKDDNQSRSMAFYAAREGGNKLVKDVTGAMFAPMIFAIPFPTMVNIPIQQNQQLIHGGNYVKNIMAFFTMFAFIWAIINRKWKEYSLIGSFVLGYLAILAFSGFAHSERFHIPTLPFELMMAAFGISLMTNKEKKYYNYYLLFIMVAIVGWSWFKLAGRGLA